MKRAIVLLLLLSQAASADTPPPGVIQLKGATDGTKIGNVGDALKVAGSFTPSGTTTVVQPTGTNLHAVIDNFPGSQAVTGAFFQATQPVSIAGTVPVSGSLGRTWSLLNTTDSVNVGNFPASFGRTWTLGFSGDKVDASGSSVSVTNFPATQPVSIAGSVPVTGPLTDAQLRAAAVPVSISGSVPVTGGLTDAQLRASAVPVVDSTVTAALGSPFQAGGSIGNTAFGISGTLPAYAATPTFNLGTLNGAATAANQALQLTQETSTATNTGTTATNTGTVASQQTSGAQKSQRVDGSGNVSPAGDVAARGVFVKPTDGTNSQAYTASSEAKVSVTQPIPAGTNLLGKVGIDQTTPGTTNGVQVNAALPAGTNSIGTVVQTALATGSISNNAAITTTASTFTAPANAIGFILEAESGNTDNIRWAVGSTATASVGMLAEPGRDSGYIPLAANISVIAISGTQSASVQWVVR